MKRPAVVEVLLGIIAVIATAALVVGACALSSTPTTVVRNGVAATGPANIFAKDLHIKGILYFHGKAVQLVTSGPTGPTGPTGGPTGPTGPTNPPPTGVFGVHVANGDFVDGNGKSIRLLGVDVSGTEDACIQNKGFAWDALNLSTAQAIASWHATAVRVPLNEDCWLAINGSPAQYSGAAYQATIKNWVAAINAAGLYAILDLHWAAPGANQATQQWPMADADHSVLFWSQVAAAFKNQPGALFEPFNEPYIGGYNANSASSWTCWLNGCSDSDGPSTYQTAGMQPIVNAIRGSGASNVILLSGLSWAGEACGSATAAACPMMSYLPSDPDHQLALNIHSYGGGQPGSSECDTTGCLSTIKQAAAAHGLPVVADEFGDTTGGDTYDNTLMNWADQNDVGYLAWAWQAGTGFWDLNTSDNGTCRAPVGCNFQQHLTAVNP